MNRVCIVYASFTHCLVIHRFVTLQVDSYHPSIHHVTILHINTSNHHHRLVIIHRVSIVYESCMYHVLIVDSSSRNTSIRHSSSRFISSILHINTSNHHHRLVIIHRVCIVYASCMNRVCIVHASCLNRVCIN